jgi:hypothetical protein
MLKRAPLFLRVVTKGKSIDALDQLEDTPKPDETIFVYKLIGTMGAIHLNRSGGRGGFYQMATYRFLSDQPQDAEVRETDAWQAWTRQAAKQLKAS